MQLLSRRNVLRENVTFEENVNANLWLNKFIKGQNHEQTQQNEEVFKQTLISEAKRIVVPDIYSNQENGFFCRWNKELEKVGAKFKQLKLDGRMIIGLGSESVLETSITLHRIYGVPFIPGSALKGLAARWANKNLGDDWKKNAAPKTQVKLANGKHLNYHEFVFGCQDFAGIVAFYDALLIPENNGKMPLHEEVMTVHHQAYYGDGSQPPADWDSPVPIGFLSASGKYLLALSTEEGLEDLLEQVFRILEHALREEGIGAKTSSGYGRGVFEKSEKEKADEQNKSRIEAFIKGISNFKQNDVPGQIGNKVAEWRKLDVSKNLKVKVAQAIIDKVNKDWKNGKQKDWYEELTKFIAGEN